MAYKQKNSKLISHNIPQQYEESEQTDERKLIEIWGEQNVNDSYQTIVLEYLDGLSGRRLKKELLSELQKTYQKSNFYFKIQYLMGERQIGIRLLRRYADQLEKYKSMQVNETPQLQKACDLIDHIRKTSMLVCQAVWEMFQLYQCNLSKSNRNSGCQYYFSLFRKFDQDIDFLKESLLKYYIPFANIYDPLFLESAKNLKLLYNENRIVFDENINQLFTLNVSYLYRLLRAHQRMTQFATLSRELQNEVRITNQYFYDPQKEKSNKLQFQFKEPKAESISKNNQKPNIQKVPSRSSSKREPQNLPIQKRKVNSRNEIKLPKQSLSKNSSRQNKQVGQSKKNTLSSNDNIEQAKFDRRAIIPCHSITIYNLRSSSKKEMKNIDENSDSTQRQSQLPKNIQPSARDRQSQQSLNKNKKRNKTQPALARKSRQQLYENEGQFQGSFSKDSPDVAQTKKKTRLIEDKSKQCEHHPFTLHRKQSKSLHLPKLSSRSKQKVQQQDCLCRQRYNSRKLRESFVDVPEEEAEQKRKMIINKINQRYREMAKKQIRYEMSLLGDRTYHNMKNKIYNSRVIKNNKLNKKKMDKKQVREGDTSN